jgi:ADP-heptose:LPS heptosyltransferase
VAPVLKGNHLIDNLYIYHKLKHGHTSFIRIILERLRLVFNLRKHHYDYILAFDHRALNLARYLRKTKVLMPADEISQPVGDDQAQGNRDTAYSTTLG